MKGWFIFILCMEFGNYLGLNMDSSWFGHEGVSYNLQVSDDFVGIRYLQLMEPLIENEKYAKGVSASFAGCIDDMLLLAGGANFPDIPAEKGGSKMYYKDVYAASIAEDTLLSWQKVGELPQPIAYGFSVSTPEGVVCVGGMN